MPTTRKENIKTWAKVSLLALLASTILHIAEYYLSRQLLESPIISKTIGSTLTAHYVYVIIISISACVAGAIFYFCSKYLIATLICGLTLIGTNFYSYAMGLY